MKNHAISQNKIKSKVKYTNALSADSTSGVGRWSCQKEKHISRTTHFISPVSEYALVDFLMHLGLRFSQWCNVVIEENVRSPIISNALTPTENCNSVCAVALSKFYATLQHAGSFNESASRERLPWKMHMSKVAGPFFALQLTMRTFQYSNQLKYNKKRTKRTNKQILVEPTRYCIERGDHAHIGFARRSAGWSMQSMHLV